jgi:hypothetical protein
LNVDCNSDVVPSQFQKLFVGRGRVMVLLTAPNKPLIVPVKPTSSNVTIDVYFKKNTI